jgi:DNA modification methylase
MGSGTTGVACAKLNRNFIGIEKNKEYYEIAKERILNAKHDLFANDSIEYPNSEIAG